MAIEGPLRELGIHDVFQLLDLSRKTGVLRISSEMRGDEGLVFFDGGRVIEARIRSTALTVESLLLQAGRITDADLERARARQAKSRTPKPMIDLLVEIGAITQKELDRQLRLQLESAVFELMSWHEGFFSFEERPREELPRATRISVSTESLLMEGARRIDEWSRIAEVVPDAGVVPDLAPSEAGREGATLDLLPHEWQVLTMIDGARDLRGIAAALRRDEFEIAKIAYGLATTGILTIRRPERFTPAPERESIETRLAAARTLMRAGRHAEAVEELKRAMQAEPQAPRVHLDFAFAAARAGDFPAARSSWEQFLRLAPGDAAAMTVQQALAAVTQLQQLVEAHVNG